MVASGSTAAHQPATPARLVIVDPAHGSSVGHHGEVNRQLLQELGQAGWRAELWADVALEADATAPGPLQGVFSGCGYEDPRLWRDLGGVLNLARRMEQQLALASGGGEPVRAWVGHSLLPFQILGLARHLASAPAAQVVLSLMFAPGETLEGPAGDGAATDHCRIALAALARAERLRGHRLQLGFPSRQQEELCSPLLAATGLTSMGVHPAVVGAGGTWHPQTAATAAAVLLHWGDLKRGKGREEALAVVAALLEQGVPAELGSLGWLFHLHSREVVPSPERALLEQAREEITGFTLLEGPVPRAEMLARLAACPLALLAYDPRTYAQRSSGMLWTWASARLAAGQEAAAVGYGEGWLAGEAPALGVGWRGLPAGERGTGGATWLQALGQSLSTLDTATAFTPYGEAVLGRSFAGHLVGTVLASGLKTDVSPLI